MRKGLLPPHLVLDDGFLPADFGERLDAFKKDTGLTWEVLAACLGVDSRQLHRWRRGTRPSGDGLYALILLASRIPGGVHTLLGVDVLPPAAECQSPLAAGSAPSGNGREG